MLANPSIQLLTDVGATGAGPNVPLSEPNGYPIRDIHIELSGTGAISATVVLERSLNNGRTWRAHGNATFTLSGTGGDGVFRSLWSNGAGNFRLNVTALTAGAKLNAWIA